MKVNKKRGIIALSIVVALGLIAILTQSTVSSKKSKVIPAGADLSNFSVYAAPVKALGLTQQKDLVHHLELESTNSKYTLSVEIFTQDDKYNKMLNKNVYLYNAIDKKTKLECFFVEDSKKTQTELNKILVDISNPYTQRNCLQMVSVRNK